jgi:cobalt-zinc-cadmium efflux system protein
MHSHEHHGHAHHHADLTSGSQNRRRLAMVLGLASAFSIFELTGGLITNSLALLADAFHLLSDVAALALSLFAAWISQRPASGQRTFGYRRAEILAALANGAGLGVMATILMYSAVMRFGEPAEVNGLGVVGFALGALFYECVSLFLLSAGRKNNINMRGAWLHILSDALGSLGAIASGLAIWAWGWLWADSVASIAIGMLVLRSAWGLIRDAVDILMETAPAHLDVDEIRASMLALPGVASLHDLHVWTIGSGDMSLSGHVITDQSATGSTVLGHVRALLRESFKIAHSTIQVEVPGLATNGEAIGGEEDCEGACDP